MEQTYPDIDDYKIRFYEMLPAFRNKIYIKVGGNSIWGMFVPLDIPDLFEKLLRIILEKRNDLDEDIVFIL